MATWPSTAKLLFDGFTEEPQPGVIRTEMEGGPPKQTAWPSRVMVQRPARALFTSKADYNAFRTWAETTIHRVGWFDWTDPNSGSVKQARIVGGVLKPQPQRKDLERWIITLTLETWQ
jgi:hypothetical protein